MGQHPTYVNEITEAMRTAWEGSPERAIEGDVSHCGAFVSPFINFETFSSKNDVEKQAILDALVVALRSTPNECKVACDACPMPNDFDRLTRLGVCIITENNITENNNIPKQITKICDLGYNRTIDMIQTIYSPKMHLIRRKGLH